MFLLIHNGLSYYSSGVEEELYILITMISDRAESWAMDWGLQGRWQ
jgi:hypothetical protein